MLAADIKKRIETRRAQNETEAMVWLSLPCEDDAEEEVRAGAVKEMALMHERCSTSAYFRVSRNVTAVIANSCLIKFKHLGYDASCTDGEYGPVFRLQVVM